ncbi:MAG: branched-chain amino acid ABC transporter permease [Alphaproteobacteria bacterium]
MARNAGVGFGLVLLVMLLSALPSLLSDYTLSFAINTLAYVVLATAWVLFSGATRYISLASAAFFGVGAYTVAVLGEVLPLYAVFAVALAIGLAIALLIGLSTLRISGMHFVIFSFGLTELVRQLTIWWEINNTRTLGRFVSVEFDNVAIYHHLLGLAILVYLSGWLLGRSRLGFALRVIGEDEQVARQVGIDTPRAKLAVFALSALFMTATGAVMAPRWNYINPNIAFNPDVSVQVVIMALLGGIGRLWGPALGVIPLAILSELLSTRFPQGYVILLGLVFMAVIYVLPQGLAGATETLWRRRKRTAAQRPEGT